MSTVELVLEIVGLVFGIVAVIEANGRSWAGWGVIALAAALLVPRL